MRFVHLSLFMAPLMDSGTLETKRNFYMYKRPSNDNYKEITSAPAAIYVNTSSYSDVPTM